MAEEGSVSEAGPGDGHGYPFGNPDGARADFDDLTKGFIAFTDSRVWGDLAYSEGDLRGRVFVGRKGSGKTVYLRRLHAFACRTQELLSGPYEQEPPDTDLIVRFCQAFSREDLPEKWTDLWKKACKLSLLSILLHDRHARASMPEDVRARLIAAGRRVLGERCAEDLVLGVFRHLCDVLATHTTQVRMKEFLNNPSWDALDHAIHEGMREVPPVCLFLDGVDEKYERAPMFWMRCQQGLFYAVMHLLRDQRFGGRLHIFASVRDIVLAKVMQSEHATRYVGEPHIKGLYWNGRAIRELFKAKIARLEPYYFVKTAPKDIVTWLGMDTIFNERRKIDEPIMQYILRHTRLLPRDVITFGNALTKAISQARYYDDDVASAIRHVVHEESAIAGHEQLSICGRQIGSDQMPRDAGRRGYSDAYTAVDEYVPTMVDKLKLVIQNIGVDRFDSSALEKEKNHMPADFEGVDPFTVLWQNGLLGYVDETTNKKGVVFYGAPGSTEFRLRIVKGRHYAFHSCLIDAVGIKATGEPVVQEGLL